MRPLLTQCHANEVTRLSSSPVSREPGKRSQTCPCQAVFQCRSPSKTIASHPCSHSPLLDFPGAQAWHRQHKSRKAASLSIPFTTSPSYTISICPRFGNLTFASASEPISKAVQGSGIQQYSYQCKPETSFFSSSRYNRSLLYHPALCITTHPAHPTPKPSNTLLPTVLNGEKLAVKSQATNAIITLRIRLLLPSIPETTAFDPRRSTHLPSHAWQTPKFQKFPETWDVNRKLRQASQAFSSNWDSYRAGEENRDRERESRGDMAPKRMRGKAL